MVAAAVHEPEVIRDKAAMNTWSCRRRVEGKVVALVPTMGFLHEGHLSLVSAAAAASAGPVAVVVSIYVNPSQFALTEDLATYPSDFAGDLRKLAATGVVAAVFCPPDLYVRGSADRPSAAGVYGGTVSCLEDAGGHAHETWIRVEQLEKGLCGSSRPVFFRGVATVVAKLFNIVEPDVAVFGKKDYQQWRLICQMALSISRSLVDARTAALSGSNHSQHIKDQIVQILAEAGGQVDYVEIVEQESLVPVERMDRPCVICVAAWFGKVRLIDNIEIQSTSSDKYNSVVCLSAES
ncbi:unnamed protein product [Miscanthus lutarioriparius]|uniref:Pantoate--beta-alanine ligase n=1 Tax=Miscanthus lutarioriparius TaxID=422564 RepID=A0A811NQ12_9POAL|nr:unnamed protein product [Miscanthus lutarioriparius]